MIERGGSKEEEDPNVKGDSTEDRDLIRMGDWSDEISGWGKEASQMIVILPLLNSEYRYLLSKS